MLDFAATEGPSPKCYFSQHRLPTYIDHQQPPTTKKPFSTILRQNGSHSLDVIFPEPQARALQTSLAEGNGTLNYARVHMKLSDIVSGDFFNDYIKTGNILLVSEGRPGVDETFKLVDGTLRLEVSKPTYERLGLQGEAISSEGRKHHKSRFAIDLDLRSPNMVRGKKGFDRVLWGFEHVLNHSITWLFCNLANSTDGTGPLATFQPLIRIVEPETAVFDNVIVPTFPNSFVEDEEDAPVELLEWLSLVALRSPRVQHGDDIDPYLCRYTTPTFVTNEDGSPSQSVHNLTTLRWRGLIPSSFVTKILLACLKASGDGWFALTARSFESEAYTLMKLRGESGESALVWEYAG